MNNEILFPKQHKIIEEATYSLLRKAFEKQTKIIEMHRENKLKH